MLDINNFEPYTLEKVKPLILTTTFKSKNRNKEKEYKNIITFDIETTTISKEKAPMYIWQINVNGRNFYGRYWEEFVEFIDYLKTLDHLSYIWVHNLKFEFHYIQSKLDFYDEDLIKVKSHAVIRARTDNVIFRCTYAMTNESLKDLALIYDEKIGRVALHAYRIEYIEPFDEDKVKVFEAELPDDMQKVIEGLS